MLTIFKSENCSYTGDRPNCTMNTDLESFEFRSWQLFATLSTFYVPLAIILFLYWRIYLTAKRRIRRKPIGSNLRAPPSTATANQESTVIIALVSESVKLAGAAGASNAPVVVDRRNKNGGPSEMSDEETVIAANRRRQASKRRNIESKRERKAAKTLVTF